MNNKEAINRLNGMQSRCENGYDAEALYLAIKALEDDHRCNDMSRLYVLDKIDGRIHSKCEDQKTSI